MLSVRQLATMWPKSHEKIASSSENRAFRGHPSKFQRVSRLGFVTAPTLLNGGQTDFARCLAVSWAGALHIFGALAP